MTNPPTPVDRLRGLKPYQPPEIDREVTLRLDANEGVPTADATLEAIRSITSEEIRRYPNARALEARIAERHAVDPECIVVTNGGDDAIDRLCRATLEQGRDLVFHAPTFEMIERGARLAGALSKPIEWLDGDFPVDAFVDRITKRTGLAAIVSPNNPTGSVVSRDDWSLILDAASAAGTVVLADLAYVEFADEDPTPDLIGEPNVVVVRTFSKALGLAGLRVGYAIAPAPIANWLRTTGGPYPVSTVSLAAAGAALRDLDARTPILDRVREERRQLTALLIDLGATVPESQANFVLARFPDAQGVWKGLMTRGISVRSFGERPGLADALRITLPADQDLFDRLTTALRDILQGDPR
ncbi:MAG: histidinol-phosphate aminotransferase family protein [Phycisphaeraceae bacterium]|nr:MAG: histidinol-phosphate aminotransferase family protein [Phycisphaeraceae bacterium]